MKWAMLFAGLTACTPVPPMENPATENECAVQGLKFMVGKPFSAELVEQARIKSGSEAVRVIRPGTAVTMDYRLDRLNVDLDEKDVVTALRCG